jgi:resuscitation-promoting factor RpfB
VVLLCIGGVAIAAGGSPRASHATAVDPVDLAPLISSAGTSAPATPSESSPAAPATSKAPGSATPKIVTRTVTETVRIPFATKNVKDSSLPKGTSKVRTRGVAGVKTVTYQVTFTDGAQTSKKLVRQQVTKEPVTQVVAIGTKQTQKCDPNYSGACVPIASDVDCAGGGGNGPAYVQGPVRVIGTDIYDLDRDGDGIGCD